MTTQAQKFLEHVCQTSQSPMGLEIERAAGSCLFTKDGKRYLDFISGIGVANIGHGHPKVVKAIQTQAERYLHVMVYGEYVLSPQVDLASRLAALLPDLLEQIYFTNSGTEANEGALKLAKKKTGRRKIVSFEGSFHGDTHGSCSVTGREIYRRPFEPLLPGISFLPFNDCKGFGEIDTSVAAVIVEPIQGEGGIRVPDDDFLPILRARCSEVGAILIFDEAQTGFGRTGRLFAMQHWNVVPDLVTFAKGMGGGMPLGAFCGSRALMSCLSENPPLSHVTTFGGHPVSCAAGLASLKILLDERLPDRAEKNGHVIRGSLKKLAESHSMIRDIRGKGLMIGLALSSSEIAEKFVSGALARGLILGWTLHTETVIRIMPPLNLSEEDLSEGLQIMEEVLSGLSEE